MSCPTCDHTLDGIGHGMFHCPRCGTLVSHPRLLLVVPSLISRCRRFSHECLAQVPLLHDRWKSIGIAESIDVPEARGEV
jgi:hypothetical protein